MKALLKMNIKTLLFSVTVPQSIRHQDSKHHKTQINNQTIQIVTSHSALRTPNLKN